MTHAERLRYIAGMRERFSDTTEPMFVGEEHDALLAGADALEQAVQHEARVEALEVERDAAKLQLTCIKTGDCGHTYIGGMGCPFCERDLLAAEVRRCWRAEEALTRSMYEPLEWLQRYADIRALKEQRPAAVRELLERRKG